MARKDAILSLQRHATSKISSSDDLQAILTFGFRGEALPSIGAVSRLTLTTRREQDDVAVRLLLEGGGEPTITDAASPSGTTVEVADLFFNVPARRKFLKRVSTEAGRLLDAVVRMALSRPDVAFVVREDGKNRLDAPRVRTLADRAAAVLGLRTAAELATVDRVGSTVTVRGLVSPPSLTRSNTGGIYTFVNGRHVKDRAVRGALMAAYRGLLERRRFPVAVLFIELDPAEVDVNVHPAKHEVRFRNEAAVTGSIVEAVRDALKKAEWIGRPPRDHEGVRRVVRVPAPSAPAAAGEGTPSFLEAADRLHTATVRRATGRQETSADGLPPEAPGPQGFPSGTRPIWGEESDRGWFGELQVLGQIGLCFIVAEGQAGLVVLDQHAAHERVVFERVRAAMRKGGVPTQTFLVPLQVELGPRQMRTLEESTDDLTKLGLETESFGGRTVLLKSLPAAIRDDKGPRLLTDLLDDLGGVGANPCGGARAAVQERLDAVAATIACHGSVRAGQKLAMEEMRALLKSLDRTEYAGNCPHGRPTVIEMSIGELERRFHRT
jgi:DNA mismatch repair protein MutL